MQGRFSLLLLSSRNHCNRIRRLDHLLANCFLYLLNVLILEASVVSKNLLASLLRNLYLIPGPHFLQAVSFLKQEVIEDLESHEQLFLVFLEVLFADDLESFFGSKRCVGQRVAVFRLLACYRTIWGICSLRPFNNWLDKLRIRNIDLLAPGISRVKAFGVVAHWREHIFAQEVLVMRRLSIFEDLFLRLEDFSAPHHFLHPQLLFDFLRLQRPRVQELRKGGLLHFFLGSQLVLPQESLPLFILLGVKYAAWDLANYAVPLRIVG